MRTVPDKLFTFQVLGNIFPCENMCSTTNLHLAISQDSIQVVAKVLLKQEIKPPKSDQKKKTSTAWHFPEVTMGLGCSFSNCLSSHQHESQGHGRWWQHYNSDCEREMRGPLRISFRFSSFFLRFSSSLRAFWNVSVLWKNSELSVLKGFR